MNEQPYRVAVFSDRRIYPDANAQFAEFGDACDWAWDELKRRTRWADRSSFIVTQGSQIVMQIIASERAGMFDRAAEQYTVPPELRGRA